jgi:UDP-glucose 4-epimerase
MRVLVTGAGGFVGRHVASALAARGWQVLAGVHRHRPPELESVAGIEVVPADLAGAQPLPVRGTCEAIVHCAAALPSRVPDEAELIRQNVDGMRRLLDFAAEAGVRTFLHCSSMAAFGRIEVDVVTPDTPVMAPGAYGRSKLEGERLLAAAAASGPLRALSVRLPGVVGAGSHDNFLSGLVAALRAGEPIVARNPEALFNNIVHVDDLTGFFADLLGSLAPGHRITTIAAREPMTIRAIVALLSAAAGREVRVTYETGGRPFLIDPEPARALGYRVPTVRDSLERLARDCL